MSNKLKNGLGKSMLGEGMLAVLGTDTKLGVSSLMLHQMNPNTRTGKHQPFYNHEDLNKSEFLQKLLEEHGLNVDTLKDDPKRRPDILNDDIRYMYPGEIKVLHRQENVGTIGSGDWDYVPPVTRTPRDLLEMKQRGLLNKSFKQQSRKTY